jgi:hypothetical protein
MKKYYRIRNQLVSDRKTFFFFIFYSIHLHYSHHLVCCCRCAALLIASLVARSVNINLIQWIWFSMKTTNVTLEFLFFLWLDEWSSMLTSFNSENFKKGNTMTKETDRVQRRILSILNNSFTSLVAMKNRISHSFLIHLSLCCWLVVSCWLILKIMSWC